MAFKKRYMASKSKFVKFDMRTWLILILEKKNVFLFHFQYQSGIRLLTGEYLSNVPVTNWPGFKLLK